jgi:hypothetical protein
MCSQEHVGQSREAVSQPQEMPAMQSWAALGCCLVGAQHWRWVGQADGLRSGKVHKELRVSEYDKLPR